MGDQDLAGRTFDTLEPHGAPDMHLRRDVGDCPVGGGLAHDNRVHPRNALHRQDTAMRLPGQSQALHMESGAFNRSGDVE